MAKAGKAISPEARAIVAGGINSLFGYAIIALMLSIGAASLAANAIGYCAGWTVSFFLHRHYVFSLSRKNIRYQAPRFAACAGIAYATNLAVLWLVENSSDLNPLVSQLCAMIAYSVTLFFLSREFAFRDAKAGISDNQRLYSVCCLAAIIALVAVNEVRLTHDVVWQFWISRQMLGGAILYDDIIEINPPLWFWMGVAISWIANQIGLSAIFLLKFSVVTSALISTLLTDSFLPRNGLKHRSFVAIASFFVLTLLPIYDFGQREQLALIAALPYCALISARCRCESVPALKAVTIGLMAAAGFALKHYFAAVPLLLEIMLIVSLRRKYRPLRPETLILAASAVIYVAVIVAFTPEFLTKVVPMVRLAYGGYENPLLALLIGEHQTAIYILLLALIISRRICDFRISNTAAYLVATCGFAIAYFAQQKGWQYHSLPISGLLTINLITLLAEARKRLVPGRSLLAGSFALATVFWIFIYSIGPYRSGEEAAFNSATKSLKPGDTIFVASTGPRLAWPMVEEQGYKWPSRYFALWTTAGTEAPGTSPEKKRKFEHLAEDIRTDIAHDLTCLPPKIILVENPIRNRHLSQSDFSYIKYLRLDDALANFLENYTFAGKETGMDIYSLSPDATLPRRPAGCREVS